MPFVLADHSVVTALPFLVPMAIVLGFIAWHVIRDRRAGDDEEVEETYDADEWRDPEPDGR